MTRTALVALLLLSGCVPYSLVEKSLQHQSAAHIGCPEERIAISNYIEPRGLSPVSTWTASGCDRTWSCRSRLIGAGTAFSSVVYDCVETEASEAATALRIATDRLRLESNCPAEKIALTSQAEWRRGTETAYRFEACGKPYVCTTAAGRTDCKAALAQ